MPRRKIDPDTDFDEVITRIMGRRLRSDRPRRRVTSTPDPALEHALDNDPPETDRDDTERRQSAAYLVDHFTLQVTMRHPSARVSGPLLARHVARWLAAGIREGAIEDAIDEFATNASLGGIRNHATYFVKVFGTQQRVDSAHRRKAAAVAEADPGVRWAAEQIRAGVDLDRLVTTPLRRPWVALAITHVGSPRYGIDVVESWRAVLPAEEEHHLAVLSEILAKD